MSSSTGNGGGNNGGRENRPPFFPPPPAPPPPASSSSSLAPTTSSTLASTSSTLASTSSALPSSSSSSSSTSPSASAVNLMMFNQPTEPPPPRHAPPLPVGLIVGTSVGALILGALLVTLFFLWRRRRAQKGRGVDPKYDEEKQRMIEANPVEAPQNAKVADWIRRNRVVSVSSISSFSSPTVLESVARTSFSEYSQASALPSGTSGELGRGDGGVTRPPGLYRVPGLEQITE
ncbi:hypothetical protein C8R46DRAFT_4002 [Mycena filopes]|nr:hypothetical protein C8R46DRAFT_4002 [Mycena filopes]